MVVSSDFVTNELIGFKFCNSSYSLGISLHALPTDVLTQKGKHHDIITLMNINNLCKTKLTSRFNDDYSLWKQSTVLC